MTPPKKEPGITPIQTKDGWSYRAEAYDSVTKRRQHKTFPTRTAARNWRRDQQVKFKTGQARALPATTLANVWTQWLDAAIANTVRNRSGAPYKASALRSYRHTYNAIWLPELGHVKVNELRAVHVQRVIDKLVAGGAAAQTVRNHVTALRAVMNWAVREELATANPCSAVALPSGGEVRDRVASPSEALALVQAIGDKELRALWATAFFAGLRRGELLALRWEDVDLAERTISIHPTRGSWDPIARVFGPPKSKAGVRTLKFPEVLLGFLAALDGTEGLIWQTTKGMPWNPANVAAAARQAWSDAGLNDITLHECRHTYASLMIQAGVNIKAVQEWMGHSSITTTLDRYGHLLPGAADSAADLLNAYLAKELG